MVLRAEMMATFDEHTRADGYTANTRIAAVSRSGAISRLMRAIQIHDRHLNFVRGQIILQRKPDVAAAPTGCVLGAAAAAKKTD
jgi:hypothetical protein